MKTVVGKLVFIEWHDHHSPNTAGWQDISEPNSYLSDCINWSVGWVVAEDKDKICIAGTLSDAKTRPVTVADGLTTIIRSCVSKMKVISGYTSKHSS